MCEKSYLVGDLNYLQKYECYNVRSLVVVRWQYFGAIEGLVRMYPGREWSVNFAGFYKDYDPRVRPWFISATSGPKDVVIILDCR